MDGGKHGPKLLDLSNVTLFSCESSDVNRGRALIADMEKIARFGDVQTLTDVRTHPDFVNREFEIGCDCQTSHVLTVHLDGFILNADLWDPTWLHFDYIGAPWPEGLLRHYHPNWIHRVGNGGFSLRSREFCKRAAQLPRTGLLFDLFVCQVARRELESKGLKYAPVSEALKFSRELVTSETPERTFGFHGFWPELTPPPDYYVTGTTALRGEKSLRARGLGHLVPSRSTNPSDV